MELVALGEDGPVGFPGELAEPHDLEAAIGIVPGVLASGGGSGAEIIVHAVVLRHWLGFVGLAGWAETKLVFGHLNRSLMFADCHAVLGIHIQYAWAVGSVNGISILPDI